MNIDKSLKRWGLVAGLLVIAVPASWASLTYTYDHFEQVAANSKFISMSEWERLQKIRASRRLTREEWEIWCYWGRKVGVFNKTNPCPPR